MELGASTIYPIDEVSFSLYIYIFTIHSAHLVQSSKCKFGGNFRHPHLSSCDNIAHFAPDSILIPALTPSTIHTLPPASSPNSFTQALLTTASIPAIPAQPRQITPTSPPRTK